MIYVPNCPCKLNLLGSEHISLVTDTHVWRHEKKDVYVSGEGVGEFMSPLWRIYGGWGSGGGGFGRTPYTATANLKRLLK